MDFVGQGPEGTLPDQTRFRVLKSEEILVINRLRSNEIVVISDVEPERDGAETGNDGPNLEPTFRVDIVEGKI